MRVIQGIAHVQTMSLVFLNIRAQVNVCGDLSKSGNLFALIKTRLSKISVDDYTLHIFIFF